MAVNWFGHEYHPTDKFIHWSESVSKAIEHSAKLKQAYNKIKNAGLLNELEYLMEEAATKEKYNQAELNAGESM